MKTIAIVGAGITGVTTAYALVNQGFEVTIFDRERYPAMQTSFANGGQLSASNSEVWNHHSTLIKGMKWLLSRSAPLSINPKPSWHKLSWMAEFVGNMGKYRQNTVATTRLAISARQFLFEWADREGIDFDLETRGILHLYSNEAALRHANAVNKLLAQGGLERVALRPEQMREIEPALTADYVGGYFTPSDSSGDIHKFSLGLASACRRLGVRFEQDADVQRVRHIGEGVSLSWSSSHDKRTDSQAEQQRGFDGVVICAGVASRRFASQLGDRVNIYPVKGYSITVKLDDANSQQAAPWVSLLDDEAKIVTSRLGENRFRVAGTAEFNGMSRDIRTARIDPLIAWCRRHFPNMDTHDVVAWAGLRPMLPNMMPRVGPGKKPGVFYNTGHGHLGWTLSAATAQMLAATMAESVPARVPSAQPLTAA